MKNNLSEKFTKCYICVTKICKNQYCKLNIKHEDNHHSINHNSVSICYCCFQKEFPFGNIGNEEFNKLFSLNCVNLRIELKI